MNYIEDLNTLSQYNNGKVAPHIVKRLYKGYEGLDTTPPYSMRLSFASKEDIESFISAVQDHFEIIGLLFSANTTCREDYDRIDGWRETHTFTYTLTRKI